MLGLTKQVPSLRRKATRAEQLLLAPTDTVAATGWYLVVSLSRANPRTASNAMAFHCAPSDGGNVACSPNAR